MTGPLILKDNPAEDLEAATKQYVDNHTSDVVLYTPQTLSDEQKTQARGNIGAAVAGGGVMERTIYIAVASADETYESFCQKVETVLSTMPDDSVRFVMAYPPGWYGDGYDMAVLCKVNAYYASLKSVGSYNDNKPNGFMMMKTLGAWKPIEYINPPMKVGVEYRTTERYLGKPVYAKLVDCGTIPAQGTYKTLAFLSGEPDAIVSVIAYSGMRGTTLPYYDTNGTRYSIAGNGNSIVIWNYSEPSLDTSVRALVKYIKSTD